MAVVLLGSNLGSTLGTEPLPAPESSPYGINAHTPEGLAGNVLLDQAQAAGIRWVRIDVSWQDVEPSRGVFDWRVMDALTASATSRGLNLFASVGGTPAWATDGLPYSGVPRDVRDWTDFCSRAVQRYKATIRVWGFWNEPNLSGSWNGTRQQFIDIILKPAADTVHAADASARVASPELAQLVSGGAVWYQWLSDVIQQMGSRLDIVTHHTYSTNGSAAVTAKLDATTAFGTNPALWGYVSPSVREVLVATGWFGRPFWLTETGWASNLSGEAAQATNVTGLLNDWFSGAPARSWISKIFLYELIDDGRPGIDAFGILRSDLTRKPAYDAYRDFIKAHTLQAAAARFHALVPCRVLDTRDPAGITGGQPLPAGSLTVVTVAGSCGIPAQTRSIAGNVTVPNPPASGDLSLSAPEASAGAASTISFQAGRTRANNAVLTLAADGSGTLTARNDAPAPVHLVLDVVGTFE